MWQSYASIERQISVVRVPLPHSIAILEGSYEKLAGDWLFLTSGRLVGAGPLLKMCMYA